LRRYAHRPIRLQNAGWNRFTSTSGKAADFAPLFGSLTTSKVGAAAYEQSLPDVSLIQFYAAIHRIALATLTGGYHASAAGSTGPLPRRADLTTASGNQLCEALHKVVSARRMWSSCARGQETQWAAHARTEHRTCSALIAVAMATSKATHEAICAAIVANPTYVDHLFVCDKNGLFVREKHHDMRGQSKSGLREV
jgi:hypothetical protein